jgi:hypothetical protein
VNNVWRMLRKSRPLWVTVRNAVLFNAIWMGFGFFHRAVVSRAIWRIIPSSVSVYLGSPVWWTRALLRCKFEGCLP